MPTALHDQELTTGDLYLAATLIAAGHTLARIEDDTSRLQRGGSAPRRRFLFPPEARPLAAEYFLGSAVTNVRDFVSALQNLRDAIRR